jgi:NAD(P)-dependent dehydrogenase (short-subunit alcohol dehydrogenase family)
MTRNGQSSGASPSTRDSFRAVGKFQPADAKGRGGYAAGKVALVTGCGGEHGLGRCIARRLVHEGAVLVITDGAPAGLPAVTGKPETGWGGLEAVAQNIRESGCLAQTTLVDIRFVEQVEQIVARTIAAFGHLDILGNNAATPVLCNDPYAP